MLKIKSSILILIIVFTISNPFTKQSSVYAAENSKIISEKMNQILDNTPDLQGAIAGISIRSGIDGKVIYQHQGDIRLRPASNMKLLTAAAALDVLGEDYSFPTEIYTDGPVKKHALRGNLYIKGKGDPTLMKSDFNQIARELRELGIKEIKGDLIADDTWYDNVRYSRDLPWSDETAYYGAQISALTASPTNDYDAGSITVEVKPGAKIGTKPHLKISPKTQYVKLVNHAETIEAEGKREITIEREHAKNVILIKGTVPIKAKPVKEWIGVWDPSRYAVTLFKQALSKQGIRLTGKVSTGVVPDSANMVTVHYSMPLSELVIPFMKLSNNVHAEMLIKEMGKVKKGEGSWEKGLEVLITELIKFGVNPETMVLRDGSGVSHVDLIPANQITLLLFSIQKETWFPAYFRSLPVAGEKGKMTGGTLENRMQSPDLQGRVVAKTGSISTVSSLSGYLKTKSGQPLIFSILLNNLLDDAKGKRIENRIVQLLVNL